MLAYLLSRLRSSGQLGLVLAAGVLMAAPVGATPFTLEDTLSITGGEAGNPGVVGELRPVRDGFGNIDVSGIILPVPQQDGSINAGFAGQDVFVVDLVLFAGSSSVDEIGITVGITFPAFLVNPVGAGGFDDGGGLVEPTTALADTGNLRALFDFSGDTVDAGDTTVRLFLTTEPESQMMNGQTATFMISSGTDFTVQGMIIPEPTTALLVVIGLAGLGFASRSRRTRH